MCASIKKQRIPIHFHFEHSIEIRRRIYQKLLECKCGKCDTYILCTRTVHALSAKVPYESNIRSRIQIEKENEISN